MKFKVWFVLWVFFGVGITLSSCTGEIKNSSQPKPAIDSSGNTELPLAESRKKSLTIWWEQAYTPGENEAIHNLVAEWEKQSGIKTILELRPGALDLQVLNAIERGNPPDLVGPIFVALVDPIWEGKLTDVSDVVMPIRDRFNPTALDLAQTVDPETDRRVFYGLPIGMFSYHIHYWQPYLDRLGLQQSDIPEDWHEFWEFWEEIRDRLQQDGDEIITSFCIPLSTISIEGFDIFLLFLQGNNVNIIDKNSRFVLDRHNNRQGLINTLFQLSGLYREGLIPPDAFEWGTSENNTQFLNRRCLLTINATLSIPTTQKLPLTAYTQPEYHRYHKEIVTLPRLPNTADGSILKASMGAHLAIVPHNASNPEAARQFLTYLSQHKTLQQWTEQASGRFFPAMPELLQTPFWQDRQDPHLSAIQTLLRKDVQPFLPAVHPAYEQVRVAGIFSDALTEVVSGDRSPEEAADRAIARVQAIVEQHKS
ncbi:ABC transporter substrate-binding protein [Roseofilum casamattae]|uniref:ABC transporter substrate-binding protein n=1 Tax=Roseofilum casamattae BLCC-M143 TaxID=3022442 RepID=A0ABT7BYB6_9CYAN|nr:ABC transporter substrate-binding protein [Roseofilum casamattae]MDJ1183499.1 ABC transporter substrate-binding protein [Roseofilum casamattae BLCC-M143]